MCWAPTASIVRYESDGTAVIVAAWGRPGPLLPSGSRISLSGRIQQRPVSPAMELSAAEASVPRAMPRLRAQLSSVATGLSAGLEDDGVGGAAPARLGPDRDRRPGRGARRRDGARQPAARRCGSSCPPTTAEPDRSSSAAGPARAKLSSIPGGSRRFAVDGGHVASHPAKR